MLKFEKTAKRNHYRTLICKEKDCGMMGDDFTPWKITQDDNGEVSLECGICGEPANLTEMVEASNE